MQTIEFRNVLLDIARTGTLSGTIETPYGTKYIVDGKIARQGQSTSVTLLRTVWLTDEEGRPRLVTAYPLPKETNDVR